MSSYEIWVRCHGLLSVSMNHRAFKQSELLSPLRALRDNILFIVMLSVCCDDAQAFQSHLAAKVSIIADALFARSQI